MAHLLSFPILGFLLSSSAFADIVILPPTALPSLVSSAVCRDAQKCNQESVTKIESASKEATISTTATATTASSTSQAVAIQTPQDENEHRKDIVVKEEDGTFKVVAPQGVALKEVKDIIANLVTQKTTGVKTNKSRSDFLRGSELLEEPAKNEAPQVAPSSNFPITSHGDYTGYNKGIEALEKASSALSQANDTLRSNSKSFLNYSNPLSTEIKNLSRSNLLNFARKEIEFPRSTVNLASNRLFASASKLSEGSSVTNTMKDIFQKDLRSAPLSSMINSLNTLATDQFFQSQAGKIIGEKNLVNFNLAALGASLISQSDSTVGDLLGTNKSLNGQLDGLIKAYGLDANQSPGTSVNIASTEEWLDAARILSSDQVTDKIPDKTQATLVKKSYLDLMALLRKMGDYKSSDLLNLISVPLKYSPSKSQQHLKEKIMTSVSRTLRAKDTSLDHPEGLDPLNVKETLEKLYQNLLTSFDNTEKFLAYVEEVFIDKNFQTTWALFDQPAYITTRRALALLTLNFHMTPLENIKTPQTPITTLIINSFEYIEIRRRDAKQRQILQAKEDEEKLKEARLSTLPE